MSSFYSSTYSSYRNAASYCKLSKHVPAYFKVFFFRPGVNATQSYPMSHHAPVATHTAPQIHFNTASTPEPQHTGERWRSSSPSGRGLRDWRRTWRWCKGGLFYCLHDDANSNCPFVPPEPDEDELFPSLLYIDQY